MQGMQTLEKRQRGGAMCRIACDECGHAASHSPVWLATMGNSAWTDTLYDVVQRCVCRRCGSRQVRIWTGSGDPELDLR
jgi:hypothetical protein